ncbi:purine-cytosine permease family protein [Paracoccus laeviglucosivorans]|uniref:Nucleobase:cation symporter-1, NCS1 family n=1 Tax=Paracoccus laeviglucosivorans TaxID=1197861 RepID=A0A521EZU0_9RHOB|nr:cytosine permease [Paracoccus laeviglucosivorans]SMO89458.1 nucleobase:cation symporter-1, NCS1 family [Paracoccus laeviglucosivorans]
MAHQERSPGVIEENSIGFVPLSQRHGRPRDLFTLWFTTNIAPLPVVTGAMAVQVFHLPLAWAFSAIVLGNIVGALVLAACSAQGPQMGLAQMIQSRGQFGRYGALLVVGFATLLYLGFFTSNIVLAAKSLHSLVPAVGLPLGAVISALAAAGIAILGYNMIHLLNRIGIWFMGLGLLLAAISLIAALPADAWLGGEVTPLGWLSMFSLAAVWHLSYACYTSDYSRYLPPSVGIRAPFMASFLGASMGTSASFFLGAIAVAGAPADADAMVLVSHSVGVLSPVLLLLFVLNIVTHNALNIYGAVLSLITMAQTFIAAWQPTRRTRVVMSVAVLIGCLIPAMLSAETFVPRFISFVVALMVVLAPWATINIVDFYVVRKGRYDIAAFFRPDGGVYGRFNGNAAKAYVAGILVQIPFLSTSFFTGPLAAHFGGLDIGWLIAPIVTGALYLRLGQPAPAWQRE